MYIFNTVDQHIQSIKSYLLSDEGKHKIRKDYTGWNRRVILVSDQKGEAEMIARILNRQYPGVQAFASQVTDIPILKDVPYLVTVNQVSNIPLLQRYIQSYIHRL